MQLFFILGNHPELSLAELRAVLKQDPMYTTKEYALFEANTDVNALQKRLAGTIKIAKNIGETIFTTERALAEYLFSLCPPQEGKILFGISTYGTSEQIKSLRIGLELKKQLRQHSVKVRLVTSRHAQLSSADLLKNKVLENGFEFILFFEGKKIIIAQTLSFQPLEFWSNYDMSRPARDMKRGMLPPKLARLMVNLSDANEQSTLLDPFCGTGTILEQSALIGITKIVGSDNDPIAIDATRENFKHLQSNIVPTLRVSTAKNVHALIEPHSISHIVTEPYLGKPRTGKETYHEMIKEIESLNALYCESFIGFKRILEPRAKIVISLPRHYLGKNPVPDHFVESIEKTGYKKIFESLYKHADQFVGRNIVIFNKQ